MFTECSKTETEELEKTTIPIDNILLDKDKDLKFYSLYFSLLTWTSKISPKGESLSIYQKWQKFSDALSFKPQYHKIYECRNAVWGLKFKNHGLVVYLDKRGLRIQVSESIDKKSAYEILNNLHLVLFGKPKIATD